MAIGCVHTEWLFRVLRKGAFDGRTSILDLGPQDIQTGRKFLENSIRRNLAIDPTSDIAAICDEQNPRKDCQPEYYRLFGPKEYKSADLTDDRADYRFDLNSPIEELPRFDVVTDFGTAEHVYNIAQVFDTMHKLLVPGGLALHCVPAFAFPNHGFYTPNPNLFIEFARANNYELVDFSYVDNMFVRERTLALAENGTLSFDRLPIQLSDLDNTQAFMTKVVLQFYSNIRSAETKSALKGLAPSLGRWAPYPSDKHHMCYVFDLMFVAMIKPQGEHRPLNAPIQRMEGVNLIPQREERLPP
ncbi:class I SAM-dependent methyltransferase [Pseudolabrys taiwanensis]|uniref:Class I SAM-dependent methyltransferase n=2 Tax=Pseudolabrys taiwanensis TaxID=331696 RepID=A0A345ZQ79_9HYPH|nr:class I SAM-dependent methyltransferase [Pseudolabrys taiwanensis]